MDPDEAMRIIQQIASQVYQQPFAFLAKTDGENLLAFIQEEHPQTIVAKAGLAQIYSMQYKFEEAEPLLTESVELGRTVLGPGHVWNLFHRFLLSNVYVNLGRYEEAESQLQEVFADGGPVLPDDSLIMRVAAGSMTNLYVLWDRADRLNSWCSEEIKRLAQVNGGDDLSMAVILNRLGYRLSKVVKAKPQRKIPETDAIFENVEKKPPQQNLWAIGGVGRFPSA